MILFSVLSCQEKDSGFGGDITCEEPVYVGIVPIAISSIAAVQSVAVPAIAPVFASMGLLGVGM